MKASHRRPRSLWPYIILAVISLVLLTMARAARAQGVPPCMSFPAAVEALASQYRENPIAVGLVNQGAAVVLFSAADGATWTIVVRRASGETCFLATGTNWLPAEPQATGKEG